MPAKVSGARKLSVALVKQSELITHDGERLHVVTHQAHNPVGTVVLAHGLGEHSGRYEHVVQVFTCCGLNVVRFDHRGHGKSSGVRGHVPAYEDYLDDLTLVLDYVRSLEWNHRIVLYGHSMGGGIIANWCLRRMSADWSDDIIGAFLSAPWFRLTITPPQWKYLLIRSASVLWPTFSIPTGLRAHDMCRDPIERQLFETDPLNHRRITMQTAIECYHAGHWALRQAARFPVPLLAVHGLSDRITSPFATQEFCGSIPGARFVPFEDLAHEPHHDEKWQEVVYHIAEWILRRYQFAYAA